MSFLDAIDAALAPWFVHGSRLLVGAAVLIPIILHFFYRPRYRRLPWAAMTFLRQALEQTSRRLRFQELILLLLRCLLILLLAVALARPKLSDGGASGRGESIDAVFVFDTSYSMGARDGDATRLDRAKAAALAVIDELPPNSTVQVYACSDRVTGLGPVSPANLDQARQVVEGVELTSQAGDVLPGLTEAYAALDRGAGANKEVYLFTDLQKSGWVNQSGAVRAKAAEIRQRAALVVVRCGDVNRQLKNVAVADITYPNGIPHTGSRLPVTVLLKNTGKEQVRNVTVELAVDGGPAKAAADPAAPRADAAAESARVEEIEPGQTVPVTLTAMLDRPGQRLLTARLTTPDDLPGDDALDRLVPVRDLVRVLVVDGAPDPRDPKQAGSHFLRNALVPVPGDQARDYFVRVTVVPPEEAGPGLLGDADVCILCNAQVNDAERPGGLGLSKDFIDRLAGFVRAGGGLVIGTGDYVEPARYNAALGAAGVGLLPFDLAAPAAAPPDAPFKPAPDSTEAPSFLARFRDDPFRTVTADVDVLQVTGAKEDPAGGRVMMRLADGKPLITARAAGDGEVVVVHTALDTSWSNWPARAGSYLSFVQFTLAHLTGRTAGGANRVAGEPLVWNPFAADAGQPETITDYEVLRPGGRRVNLGKPTGGENGSKLTVTAPDTPVAGVYWVGPAGKGPPAGARFAVAPDLRESANLDTLSDAELEEQVGFRPVLVAAGAEGALTAERSKRELTIWVLLTVFLMAGVEAGWAWFCGKAW